MRRPVAGICSRGVLQDEEWPKWTRVIQAISASSSQEIAAQRLHIAPRTLYRYGKQIARLISRAGRWIGSNCRWQLTCCSFRWVDKVVHPKLLKRD